MGEDALSFTTKGLPHSSAPVALSDIGAQRWNVLHEDLPLPVAVVRKSAIDNNRRWMKEFLQRTGARLAPHGKTTMSPEFFRWQLEDGAWAITLSTLQQVRVARAAGLQRILLANPLVSPRDIDYVLEELRTDPQFDFRCLVDSVAGVERLATTAQTARVGRPLKVLLEIGHAGGRTGCRDLPCALAVARAIEQANPYLSLEGVEGYEGLLGQQRVEDIHKIRLFLEALVASAELLDAQGLLQGEEVILSAGGSAYYDLVTEILGRARLSRTATVVLRSGCYLTHDAGRYEELFTQILERSSPARSVAGEFQNALEIWAYVISVPEGGRAILGAGRRDFGHDAGPPVPLKHCRPGASSTPTILPKQYEIVSINDQHAHLAIPPAADIALGDMVALGISHPCTTFDKWQLLYLVDDAYDIVSGIRTYF